MAFSLAANQGVAGPDAPAAQSPYFGATLWWGDRHFGNENSLRLSLGRRPAPTGAKLIDGYGQARGAFQTHDEVTQIGKHLEVASGPAAKIEYRERRVTSMCCNSASMF